MSHQKSKKKLNPINSKESNFSDHSNYPFERRFTEAETAEILRKSKSWLQKKRFEGGGIPFVRDGGRVFYLESSLKAHVLSCKPQESTSQTIESLKPEDEEGGKTNGSETHIEYL